VFEEKESQSQEMEIEEAQRHTLKDVFEPREMEEIFQTEEDIRIRDLDVPERLQLRFKK